MIDKIKLVNQMSMISKKMHRKYIIIIDIVCQSSSAIESGTPSDSMNMYVGEY